MIPLAISLSSLILSCTAYSKSKKQCKLQKIYVDKLKQKQIDLNKVYGVVRDQRNNIHKKKMYLGRSNGRNANFHINSLNIADEYLEDIENCIQNMID